MMLSLCTNRAVKDGQTTRLTQTLMKRCHFIPKNQDEKKSYQTLSLLSYFIIFFPQANSVHALPFKQTSELNLKPYKPTRLENSNSLVPYYH